MARYSNQRQYSQDYDDDIEPIYRQGGGYRAGNANRGYSQNDMDYDADMRYGRSGIMRNRPDYDEDYGRGAGMGSRYYSRSDEGGYGRLNSFNRGDFDQGTRYQGSYGSQRGYGFDDDRSGRGSYRQGPVGGYRSSYDDDYRERAFRNRSSGDY